MNSLGLARSPRLEYGCNSRPRQFLKEEGTPIESAKRKQERLVEARERRRQIEAEVLAKRKLEREQRFDPRHSC